jgi:hypothetical protein
LSSSQPLSAPYTTRPLSMAGRSIPMPNPSPAAQQFIQHRNRVHHQSQNQTQEQQLYQYQQNQTGVTTSGHVGADTMAEQAPGSNSNHAASSAVASPLAHRTPRSTASKSARGKTRGNDIDSDQQWTPIPPPTPSGRRTPVRHQQQTAHAPERSESTGQQSAGSGAENTNLSQPMTLPSPSAARKVVPPPPPPPNPKNLTLFHDLPAHFDLFRTPLGYSAAVNVTSDAGLRFHGECVADALGRSEAQVLCGGRAECEEGITSTDQEERMFIHSSPHISEM